MVIFIFLGKGFPTTMFFFSAQCSTHMYMYRQNSFHPTCNTAGIKRNSKSYYRLTNICCVRPANPSISKACCVVTIFFFFFFFAQMFQVSRKGLWKMHIQSNLGYPNSFVLRILYCVRISEFVQITEVVAKISRKRLVWEFITFQLLLNSPNYSLMHDRSHSTR